MNVGRNILVLKEGWKKNLQRKSKVGCKQFYEQKVHKMCFKFLDLDLIGWRPTEEPFMTCFFTAGLCLNENN